MALNLPDQARWELDQQWRQTTETLAYWWEQFLSAPQSDFQTDLNWLEPLAKLLAVLLVGLVLGVVLVRLGQWLWRKWPKQQATSPTGDLLSVMSSQSVQAWLRQAQASQAQEDYGTACRAYYMALILRLRAGNWLNRGEFFTNGEYWRDLEVAWALGQHPPRLRQPIQQLFQTHSRLYYGGQDISPETMAQCREAYFQVEPDLIKPSPPPKSP
ncbi:DUF4129 domain-containing protein [Thermosynechococcaceae cyanobacterium BACA0444]|uniref:DUF4129 domain-containing protein n=1 Tax=Pseudocalidococcus azoricus BACA0444 TaxID=2918990 RepID=A0AAE4FRZ9_9CYAN|nr:DUF4129 domain-containing protein [Pseudocalidococcus azoricus]MDS3859836.1 DUF4129 domain-containing protein [Pseudocalidococcus azoricus BACA0444]